MIKLREHSHREDGAINILLIPFILIILFFIGAVAFGFWAFSSRQDFKNHSDQKSVVAVDAAIKTEDVKKDAQFAQDEKKPLKTYAGPEAYGGIKLSYPKTWSGYVSELSGSSIPVDGYFSPGVVPALTATSSIFSLRVQVLDQSYSSVMNTFAGLVTSKKVTVAPYSLKQVSGIVGSRIEGTIVPNKQGVMIVLPVRDKTLKIWTESPQFQSDLDTTILPNFSFSP